MKIVIASFILQSLLFSQSSIAQAYDCPSAQTQISNEINAKKEHGLALLDLNYSW
jgi:hypothetical protein